jgi:hypothetical protein
MIIEVRTERSTELILVVRVLEELPIAFKDDVMKDFVPS